MSAAMLELGVEPPKSILEVAAHSLSHFLLQNLRDETALKLLPFEAEIREVGPTSNDVPQVFVKDEEGAVNILKEEPKYLDHDSFKMVYKKKFVPL